MIKKIVISPDNKRAVEFFETLSKKKEELKKKFEGKSLLKKKSLLLSQVINLWKNITILS